jgi:pimeloyl-ACP methyl ester carboxylesterase
MNAVALRMILVLAATSVAAAAQERWIDPSSHVQRKITVDAETTVEVLEWRGPGRAVILLAQLGQTAHIYDDWAASLAHDYRVLAITRRGYGESVTRTNAYSTERLARDVLAVIDSEHVERPILVGHGMAGEELSWIGVNAPERISGLVYLDAAYDRTHVGEEAAIAARIPTQPSQPHDMTSVSSVVAWMSRNVGGAIPEAEVRQMADVGPDGRVIGPRSARSGQPSVLAQLTRVDPAGIRVPVLALYAPRTSATALPGCQAPEASSVREACGALSEWMTQQLNRSKQLFAGIPQARIADLAGANSFMFLSNPIEVAAALKTFASEVAH